MDRRITSWPQGPEFWGFGSGPLVVLILVVLITVLLAQLAERYYAPLSDWWQAFLSKLRS